MATLNVGISDMKIGTDSDILVTYALGSCVGICLYDKTKKLAGLAHIMLPWSKESASADGNIMRFADTGITELVKKMCQKGTTPSRLTAKIAGGAQMFQVNSAVFNIGDRNVQAVKTVLSSYRIPIIAEQAGSNFGRTLYFYAETGIMEIRAAVKPTVKL